MTDLPICAVKVRLFPQIDQFGIRFFRYPGLTFRIDRGNQETPLRYSDWWSRWFSRTIHNGFRHGIRDLKSTSFSFVIHINHHLRYQVNKDNKLPPLESAMDLEDIMKFKKHFKETEPQFERLINELLWDVSSQLSARTPFQQSQNHKVWCCSQLVQLQDLSFSNSFGNFRFPFLSWRVCSKSCELLLLLGRPFLLRYSHVSLSMKLEIKDACFYHYFFFHSAGGWH